MQNVKPVYGYQINPVDDQTIVYKNIEISKRTSGENLLRCYKAPYFDDSDSSILRIDAKNSATEAPTAYTEIIVKILRDMFITENNEQISLVKQHSWPYLTNKDTDSVAPQFHSSFKVKMENNAGTELSTTTIAGNDIPTYNLKNKKLWVMGKVLDEHSGPASVQWKVEKVSSQYYTYNSFTESGYVQGLVFSGNDAFFGSNDENTGGCEIDLSNVLRTQGAYKVTFTVYDKVGLTADSQTYHFIYDVEPPAKPAIKFTYSQGKAVYFNYSTSNNDVAKLKFVNTNTSTTSESTNLTSYNIASLTNNTDYTFNITTVDYAGNESEAVSTTERVGAAVGQYVYYDKTNKRTLTSLEPINFNGISNIILAGIVYDISDLAKVRIINTEHDELNGIPAKFINISTRTSTSNADGLSTYTNHKDTEFEVWKTLSTFNSKFYNNNITWYIPSVNEMGIVLNNRDVINTALNKASYYSSQKIYSAQDTKNKYITSTAIYSNGWTYRFYINDQLTTPAAYSGVFYYRRIAQLNFN